MGISFPFRERIKKNEFFLLKYNSKPNVQKYQNKTNTAKLIIFCIIVRIKQLHPQPTTEPQSDSSALK